MLCVAYRGRPLERVESTEVTKFAVAPINRAKPALFV